MVVNLEKLIFLYIQIDKKFFLISYNFQLVKMIVIHHTIIDYLPT